MAEQSKQRESRDESAGKTLTDSLDMDFDASETTGNHSADSTGRFDIGMPSFASVRGLLLTLAALGLPAAVGSAVVPVIGGPVGIVAGSFLLGVLSETRYRSVGVAGLFLGAIGALVGNATLALVADASLQLAAIGAVAGGLISLVGLYFGRDLRAGLAKDLS